MFDLTKIYFTSLSLLLILTSALGEPEGRLDLHAVGSGYLLGEGARGKQSKGEGKLE